MNKVIFIIRYCFFTTTHVCTIYIKVARQYFPKGCKSKIQLLQLILGCAHIASNILVQIENFDQIKAGVQITGQHLITLISL